MLCVAEALDVYIKRTNSFKEKENTMQLFFKKKHKRSNQKFTIARYTLKLFNITGNNRKKGKEKVKTKYT